MHHKRPTLGIVAASSNMGKTSVITKLLPIFASYNIRVSVIKHAHHQFDIDHPGKDSFNIRKAGAVQTLVASDQRWALMTEIDRIPDQSNEANLSALLQQINPDYADLILVEGFKHAAIPKIEIHRQNLQLPLLSEEDDSIIAVATDEPLVCKVPQLALNEPATLCQFIIEWMNTQHD